MGKRGCKDSGSEIDEHSDDSKGGADPRRNMRGESCRVSNMSLWSSIDLAPPPQDVLLDRTLTEDTVRDVNHRP